ncbi:MAG: amidohydrolase family protein [Sphingomonadaceae bacterium]|nr:amidohydrolase family protein [Sphingomonadaceae bacterium]
MGRQLNELLLRDVEVEGQRVDVRLADGRVAEIGESLPRGGETLEGLGGALLPGLIDHHIHLLAAAAARESVDLSQAASPDRLDAMLRVAASAASVGGWIRATGFHEHRGGALDRERLDRIVPDRPVRVQHQTGSTWFLNSMAVDRVGEDTPPPGVDLALGRAERADEWLRGRIGADPPGLGVIGRDLAAAGVTGVSDASVTNDTSSAALFADAQAAGELPQRVMMMSGGTLELQPSDRLMRGPVKILLDDHRLPPLEAITAAIHAARRQGRRVGVHCVTAGELALTLAAFAEAGAISGDRIEHGGVIPASSLPVIAKLRLTIVTQPAFPWQRGDRYLAEVEPREHSDLYRCATLLRAGVPVGGSSDAPYASLDPWAAMRAATTRLTPSGQTLGADEAINPRAALNLYLGRFEDPGGAPRRVVAGAPADLCLLDMPLTPALKVLGRERVRATFRAGEIIFAAPGS